MESLENKVNDNNNDSRFVVKLKIGNLSAEGTGKSKKEAKQKSSQIILKKMYPQYKTWGDLLDFYEKEKEYHKDRGPNLKLLEQLKNEMKKRYPESQHEHYWIDKRDELLNTTDKEIDFYNEYYKTDMVNDNDEHIKKKKEIK